MNAADRFGVAAGGGNDAYDLEPARQACERKAGFYLVLVSCRSNYFLSIVTYKPIIPYLDMALPYY